MTVHRVRLSDGDIKDIARALKWFTDLVDKKGLLELEDRIRYRELYYRFGDWGSTDEWRDRPLYRRTRRPRD